MDLHINEKELLAVLFSLKSLLRNVTGKVIKVLSDNAVTVSYINSMGGKMQICYNIARDIWEWAISHDNSLVSAHILGKLNIPADALSRSLTVNTEWSLDSKVFEKIAQTFPGLEIDLFACRMNFKIENYVSWLPDPGAKFCNAFTLDWKPLFSYAFPPFSLIGKVLKKVQEDQAKMVIVVPDWPTSPWYSRFFEMSIDTPLYFPGRTTLLTNQLEGDKIRSGLLVSCIQALNNRKRSQTSFMTLGDLEQDPNTSPIFHGGKDFVAKETLTPLRHL